MKIVIFGVIFPFSIALAAMTCPQLNLLDTSLGKTLIFAMTIKLIPEFWRNQEFPKNYGKYMNK